MSSLIFSEGCLSITPNMIIGVYGKIGAGKDTFARMIQSMQPDYDWRIKKFAGKLKEVASILTGLPIEKWDDRSTKETYMGDEWGMTYRQFMQRLGTEVMRNNLHEDVWVNALLSDYRLRSRLIKKFTTHEDNKTMTAYDEVFSYPNWIIADVRFPNEAEAIRRMDMPLVKIVGSGLQSQHISETAMDNYGRFDFIIDNTGGINDLWRQAAFVAEVIEPFIKPDHVKINATADQESSQ